MRNESCYSPGTLLRTCQRTAAPAQRLVRFRKCVQDERKTSRSQEISVNSFNEELSSSDRTRRPVKDTVAVQYDPEVYHEAGTLNIDDETLRERIEADMDFKIPRLPHSIVKHAQSTSVRQLIQKIENHKSTCSSTRSTTESII